MEGNCTGFEREGEARSISAEEFHAMVRKERDRYEKALQAIAVLKLPVYITAEIAIAMQAKAREALEKKP